MATDPSPTNQSVHHITLTPCEVNEHGDINCQPYSSARDGLSALVREKSEGLCDFTFAPSSTH
jgi:hypothetical protein